MPESLSSAPTVVDHSPEKAIKDFTTEMRERLRRTDDELETAKKERNDFYKETRAALFEISRLQEFVAKDIRESLGKLDDKVDEVYKQACLTNGKVLRNERALFGENGGGGIMGNVESLLDSRKYITIAGSVIAAFLLFFVGPERLKAILFPPTQITAPAPNGK